MQSASKMHSTQIPVVEPTLSGRHFPVGAVHALLLGLQTLVHMKAELQIYEDWQVPEFGVHYTQMFSSLHS